jgi:dienelactone hydrolase
MTQAETFRRELEKSAARMLHFGVSYGDWRKAAEAATDWDSWSGALAAMAQRYDEAGERAAQSDCMQSAVEHWRRAAVYFHYAQFKLPQGDWKRALQRECWRSYANAASWLEPAAVRFEVRHEGASFHGYLRVPPGPAASCVVLLNGLDSAREVELHAFADGFLRRGNAVFCWDGPGQGEGRNTIPMHRYSSVVSAVVDVLAAEIGDVPFGVFGVSFGGFLACHAAASDPRLEACVSLGGFHDARVLQRLPAPALDNLRVAYGLAPGSDVSILDDIITLAPLRGRLQGDLLIAHGTNDHLVDREQVDALSSWAGSRGQTLIYDGAEHVCTDRFPECLPALWDWMTQRLGATRSLEVAR